MVSKSWDWDTSSQKLTHPILEDKDDPFIWGISMKIYTQKEEILCEWDLPLLLQS